MDDRRAVIVGVGEVLGNRDRDPDAAREPLELILEAVHAAAGDAGGGDALLRAVGDVSAVRTSSWAYDDAAALVARSIGAAAQHLEDTTVGGHWPTRLLERAAARIASGETEVALLVGGEAQASVTALAKAGRDPVAAAGWSAQPGGPPSFDPSELGTPRMLAGEIVLPARVYPMFQNALQADLGLAPSEGVHRSAALYARLTEVAAANPAAWNREVRTPDDIATVAPGNRMVVEPYPLAVNAMPHVDQAAAVLVTSVTAARAHGIREDRWVHVWGGAGATDTADVLERRAFHRSVALELALDRAMDRAGLTASDLELVDVYSCFPVVPELLMRHLGLPDDATPSATGGHAAFGGPLSSYSLHAIAATTRRLRHDASVAMVHANGGYLTEQHVTVLADRAHPDGYVGDPDPTPVDATDAPPVRDAADLLRQVDGPIDLRIETWTVEHGRDGQPARAYVIGRTSDGTRVAAATAPGDLAAAASLSLAALPSGDLTHIGRTVALTSLNAGPVIVP